MKLVSTVIAMAMTASVAARADDNLNFHFVYVGQGDLTVVECPGVKKFIVIDAGSGQDSAGAKVNLKNTLPGIFGQGASVEFVLTHDHKDHANLKGAVKEIVEGQNGSWDENGPITNAANGYKGSDVSVDACGNGSVEVLVKYAQPGSGRGNDGSTVLRFAFGGNSALLMGDAEAGVEGKLAGRWGEVTLVKVAHHGSATSSTPAFLQEIKPKAAYVSAGRHRGYAHPRCNTLRTLRDNVQANLNAEHTLFCYEESRDAGAVTTSKAILATRPFNDQTTYNSMAWFTPGGKFDGSAYNGPLLLQADDEPGDDDEDDDI